MKIKIKLTTENNKLNLSFSYDEEIIDMVKSIPSASWNKIEKKWEFPATISCYKKIKEKFGLSDARKEMPIEIDWNKLKTKPFDHQKEAIKFLLDLFSQHGCYKGAGLLMSMGTGKTKVCIDTAEILFRNKLIKNILVICPLSIVETWKTEINNHASDSNYNALIGSRLKRLEALNESFKTKLTWNIINIDGVAVIKEELQKKKYDMVIIDESTTIKNRTAKRTKLIIESFSNCKYKIIMSGNPIPKSPDEIYSQYRFLDAGVFGSNYYRFMEKYCNVDYFGKVTGLKNEEEFHRELHSIAFRKTKEECLSLPPKIFEKEFIQMSLEQKQIYEAMKKDAIASYNDKTISAPVVITKFLRLSQIAGGFFPSGEKTIPILPNRKLDRLIELMEEIEGQIVVWCRFQEEIKAISVKLNQEKISNVTFYGETSMNDRKLAEEKILNKEARVFISNPSTGGHGINFLKNISNVIFYSLDFSTGNHMQAIDRTHRIGTQKSVLYLYLLMDKTIDNLIYNVIQNNKDFSEELLNRRLIL